MGKIMLQQHNALATLTWSIDDLQMSSPKQALLQQLNKQLQVSAVDRIKGQPTPRAVLLQNAHFGHFSEPLQRKVALEVREDNDTPPFGTPWLSPLTPLFYML